MLGKRLVSIVVVNLFLITYLFGISVSHSWASNISDYFPLNSGDSWTYLKDGYKTYTRNVLPGIFYVNGAPTKIIASPDNMKVYASNDMNGVRRHKETGSINEDGTNYNFTSIFSPPVFYSSLNANIGDKFNSTGSFSLTISGIGTYTLEYSSTTKIVGYETVTVPYGTFSTIKINNNLQLYGYIGGSWFSWTRSSDIWSAKYLGAVKDITTDDGLTTTEVLTNTNIIPPADRGMPWLLLLLGD
jgi:hypothetical protein